MVVYVLLVLVAASALPPFTLTQKTQSAIGSLMRLLVFGTREALVLPRGQAKFLLNSCAVLNPGVILGGRILIRTTTRLLVLWENKGNLTLLCVFLAGAGTAVLSAQTSALLVASVELQSYASYALVALGGIGGYRSSSVAVYFLVGAAGTARIILGWGWLYRVGGVSTPLQERRGGAGNLAQAAGVMAKTGCFPFNHWLPLAYGGLTYPTLRTVGVLPQVALISQIGGLIPFSLAWVYGVARASVYVGSLLAAAATPLRQLLALSGTAHVGYLISGTPFSLYPILLYSLSYAVVVILFCVSRGRCTFGSPMHLSDLRGALNAFLLEGLALHAAALNLGGVPPLLGFYAKVFILGGGIALGNLPLQIFSLALRGAVGIVAYLRISLASAGYPQTNGYLLAPIIGLNGRRRAIFLGVASLAETLTGGLYLALLL